jgi:Mitochondrial carrier protein
MGGIVSTTVLLPLDVIKVRLQVTETNHNNSSTTATAHYYQQLYHPNQNPNHTPTTAYNYKCGSQYFRTVRIVRSIVQYEGILGLYQGWTPAVLGASISWGGYFFIYEALKRQLQQQYYDYHRNNGHSPSPPHHHLAPNKINTNHNMDPTTATIPTTAPPPPPPRPATDTASSSSPSPWMLVPLAWYDHFVVACTAGAIMVALTNPIWLVKTRMQLQLRHAQQQQQQELYTATPGGGGTHPVSSSPSSSLSSPRPYRNMMDAFRTIVREEGGIRALYKGCGPALLLTSHGGVQFVIYEYLRQHYYYPTSTTSPTPSSTTTTTTSTPTNPTSSVWHRLIQSAGFLTMGAIAKMYVVECIYI